jgi:6-phosphogluconolactonase
MKKLALIIPLALISGFGLGQVGGDFFLAGTYTRGKSLGIYTFQFDPATQAARQVAVTGGIKNPSYLAVAPGGQYVYAVSELNGGGDAGKVFAYRFDAASGKLALINEQSSGGDDPCYVTVDNTGKWVIVGNYSSGSLSVLPVESNGSLGKAVTRIVHEGPLGPDKARQEKPHVHCTVLSPDNRFLLVADLGTDKIFVYRFDAANGSLSAAPTPFQVANPGSGPRHLTFHPSGKYVYLVEELTGSVSSYRYDAAAGKLTWIQRLSSLPAGFNGFAGSADIHVSPDGKFLYASNRGDANSIAIYRIDKKKGTLSAVGFTSVLGKAPRNFSLTKDGKWLLCANMDSDEIVVFARNAKTGMLTDTGKRISVPTPVCIRWVHP